jgi:uncharacterized protein with GYD domain
MKQLEAVGFQTTRAAASLGAWDVIGINSSEEGPAARLIQVKCNRRPGRAEMETLRAFKVQGGVSKEIWVYKDGKPRDPIIEIVE